MPALSLLPIVLLSAATQPAASQPATSQPMGDDGYRLVWAQEFDTPGRPDESVWQYEHGFVRNNEAQWYQPDNARVEDGLLVIEARRERVANPEYDANARDPRRQRAFADYTSASLFTRGENKWLYGRFEMRGRIDTRAGLWPAWWTLGAGPPRRHWPACGEIDMMEYFDGDLLANACWDKGDGQQNWDVSRTPLPEIGDEKWAAGFHVWRMDWQEDSILLYVDGRLLNTVAITQTRNPDGFNPFHQPHRMKVNLAIGGTRGGDPAATEFPARFEIDYIRVYQKP